MTVNLRIDEFRQELHALIDNTFVKLDAERLFEFFAGGPLIPFVGEVYGQTFILKRNVQWIWRSWHYLEGTFYEKDNRIEISYRLGIDNLRLAYAIISNILLDLFIVLVMIRTGSVFSIVIGVFLLIASVSTTFLTDRYRSKRLVTSFLTEMNMMPHNHKSRFKK